MDLTSREIKPLHIIIANNSSETFMISRSGIYISFYTKADLYPVNSNYVFSKFEYSKLKRAFFGFGLLSWANAEDANKRMKADWYSKELKDELVLRKGRRAAGFVFFETGDRLSDKVLNIPVVNLKSGTEKTLEIKIE